jgi:ion channel-forming bestrophin family protein
MKADRHTPVTLHTLFAALVVYVDTYLLHNLLGLPGTTVVPSLSIVVGLVLVFRNQTSYDRFWDGRNCLAGIQASIRNIARTILVCSSRFDRESGCAIEPTEEEKEDTERTVRCLIAVLYAVKHALREEWSCEWAGGEQTLTQALMPTTEATEVDPLLRANTSSSMTGLNKFLWGLRREYDGLLPEGMTGFEQEGLALPLQLMVMVEAYFRRGVDRGWFTGPQTIQVPVQINNLIEAYGKMEVILTTAIPVGHRYVCVFRRRPIRLFRGMKLIYAN